MNGWNPNYYGPLPAVRAPSSKAWKKQVVWPRDKKQKGPHDWSRWKDVFTWKGPDMWISNLGEGPDRPVWTGWRTKGYKLPRWDNLGYHFRQDNENLGIVRPPKEKYDFKTRKYGIPRESTWSDVKWDVKGRTPLYIRPRHLVDRPWVDPRVDGGAYNAYQGRNPFAWDEHSAYWNWHYDQYFGIGD